MQCADAGSDWVAENSSLCLDSAGLLQHCHLDNVAVEAQLLHEGNLLHHAGAKRCSQGWTGKRSSRHAGAACLGLMRMNMLTATDCGEAACQSSSGHMSQQQQHLPCLKADHAIPQGSVWCPSIVKMP